MYDFAQIGAALSAFGPWLIAPFIAYYTATLVEFGVKVSPGAAIICGLIAWRRGLPVRRYIVLGGVYALFFFLPWIYLVLRMLDRALPRFLIVITYGVVIVIWLFVPNGWGMYIIVDPPRPESIAARMPVIDLIVVGLMLVNFVTLLVSLGWLALQAESPRPGYRFERSPFWHSNVPSLPYILPFGLALMWVVAILGIGEVFYLEKAR